MINLIICGAGGRMGQALIEACRENSDFTIAGLIESQGHSMIGQKFGDTLPELSADLGKIIDQGDVVIDFTSPEASLNNARIAAQHKKPMVIGATGINDGQMKELQELSQKVPLLVSSNLSIGVNLLYDIISRAAKTIPGNFDVEIIETHHKNKKDAPSGTAKKLLSEITAVRGGRPVYQRENSSQPRAEGEIGVVSIRAGDIVGEHTVIFAGPGERLEFTHRAHSRRVFAEGALAAAKFLAQAKPRMYDMKDVLA
ncbi:MAG: 4-hydroxy-tetrahydrodipicolinate reductase [Candidatus Edwardsbacteria bacterium RIFOXYD12_FULL_50_11]|uniref:4-hydroxy-tetrahydrodipicolinate reductase n=1 Tax=Candidatus Edwardsbacteria bacterium GWF2_54_11 TaxID=1817851 RepID=A0A1F5RHY5_9BACT|nr:MAG: 4-hydroxy-tetrahydrodipicolinate reductase [Candidatus Edwardsbacteria bacterium RifOxyC12_full_54_24]OGF06912.1 MAG: 4-hydroxy-tetrahydrodipicolinate reductase [Candidatus Edwardsbacteria bacterium RifOxyA12_full_54_48]OGF10862.1 MAG: 4-hydroxy-tetrahydrodipicolinate reductase [Candidatus Edwardsbacteria bacterium GWE2_54_12]OGF13962.1 MAG: 4-hydroxy-tetrahydrodipicolinate reductase [Candidatus Edwardsbacteria bacterium GWF2_54_11]OGF14723.1 MAG: 4-hydroxy-tetrahydrodipicolinate reduct